ncbi:MAG: hypothetical protein AMXMBFR33_35860 [Candidatus Xenobia bacterium]
MARRKRRDDCALVLYIPDIHFPFHDPSALETVENLIWDQQPEELTNLGDIIDAKDLGRFLDEPSSPGGLQRELDLAIGWWDRMNELAPGAKKRQVQGNHEFRLQKHLWEHSGLFGLVDLSMKRLLRLDDMGVEWVEDGYDQTPDGELYVYHGDVVRSRSGYSGHGEMERHESSGITGHTHRCSHIFKSSRRHKWGWVEAGFLGDRRKMKYYKGYNWQQGLAYAYVGDGWWQAGVLPMRDHQVAFGGKVYTPEGVMAA